MTAASPAERSTPRSDPSSLGHGRFEPGIKLGSRYRIVGLLGRGGMGEVYRADDLELGQSVALKFLPERVAANPTELARFRNEVKLARQIAHPNVARIYDIGEADGHVFLSMEYIDGEDLASVLRRMGRPSTDKALEISRQLCLGLAAAHDAGVLHRDLKPANVMIDGRGRVRITDFGLAGLMEELEQKQELAGTPAYMAPEQLAGGTVSARSDVYSLGLILYEVFTGKRVYDTNNIAELKQMHASGSLATPSSLAQDVDPAIERLVLLCLERDPQQRPPSAYAVLGALPGGDPLAAALAAGETPSPELVANAGQTGGLRPRVAVSFAATILVMLGLLLGFGGEPMEVFDESPEVLSLRAGEVLEAAGFSEPPRYSAMGFAIRRDLIDSLGQDGEPASPSEIAGSGTVFFWKRWGSLPLEPTDIHDSVVRLNDPPQSAPGSGTVLLDVEGRLLGLEVIPESPEADEGLGSETLEPDWSLLLAAAGFDVGQLTRTPPPALPPTYCDTTAAWTGTMSGAPEIPVVIQAGAYRGRPVHFTIISETGSTTDGVVASAGAIPEPLIWITLVLFSVPLGAALFLARRNLKLGRGDRRGATRLAIFVLILNLLEWSFTLHLSEGVARALSSIVRGRGIGHALIHATSMWFFYIALEPYVRRLWPHMLVSWARVTSGRLRDPLVGRDLLLGTLFALGSLASMVLVVIAATVADLVSLPPMPSPNVLTSLTGLKASAFGVALAASMGILMVLGTLVLAFLVHLLVRRVWIAASIVGLAMSLLPFLFMSQTVGPLLAAILPILFVVPMMICLFRFGLLPAMCTIFVFQVFVRMPVTLDLSRWYADNMLLSLTVLLALTGYGFYTSLAGQPIFRDVLQEPRAAGAS